MMAMTPTPLADPLFARSTDGWMASAARSSLASFTRRMFPQYETPWHIRRLVDALECAVSTPGSRLIVTFPPRHGKSLTVSEHLPAWYLGNHPDARFIAASHTAALAYTFSRRVRNKISDPRWPFPGVRVADDKGAVQAWDIQGHAGGYFAVGTGGSPTGMGAQIISIDDPLRSAADADSITTREALWEWYRETMRTRLEPGGSIIVTSTRWQEDDLTGRLLAEMEHGGEHWEHLHLPAISDDGGPLWPERWPLAELEKIRASVGSRAWEAQYQGRPSPVTGGILKRHWFNQYDVRPMTATGTIQSWDTAFKDATTNDYSVCSTWAYGPTGAYLLDVYRERLEFPDLERMVLQQFTRWTPSAVLIEDKASGQSLIQSCRARTRIPVIAVPVRRDKVARVNEVAPWIEAGRVFLPTIATWLDETIHELVAFPFAPHDDIVDSVTQALAWIAARDLQPVLADSWMPDATDDGEENEPW